MMDTQTASLLFGCLSSPLRLNIFQNLLAAGLDGMVAGDLAKSLNMAPNLLSFHLKTLNQCGLVRSETDGRFVRYFACLELMTDLTDFLMRNCCRNSTSPADRNCRCFR